MKKMENFSASFVDWFLQILYCWSVFHHPQILSRKNETNEQKIPFVVYSIPVTQNVSRKEGMKWVN